MENKANIFNLTLTILVGLLLFIFPLFFLPITREFLIYSKFYLLISFVLVLFFVSISKFVLTKKLTWTSNPALQSFLLIVLAYILSIVLSSPNKMQALFRPQYGLVMILAMMAYYLYASTYFKKMKLSPVLILSGSGLVASVVAMLMMVNPFKNVNLPSYWGFLKNTSFNTVGSSIDLLAFLVFVLVGASFYLWRIRRTHGHKQDQKSLGVILTVIIAAVVLAIGSTLFTIAQSIFSSGAQIIMPPFNLSWFAAIEVLKNPLTAVFGVGVDNFSTIFTNVRNIDYNLSSLWQVSSFSTSRSAILHILTELGLLGLTGFSLLIVSTYKKLGKVQLENAALFITSLAILFLLPPSIMAFFLFFVGLALVVSDLRETEKAEEYEVDMSKLVAPHIGLSVIGFLVIGTSIYFVGKNFLAEIYFKRSIDAISNNSLQQLYDNQRRAVQYNPYNEEFRRNFSQSNLLVANNVAAKPAEEITDRDRQTIAQTLQVAISEGKSAVALNPGRVTNWQNLATVYRQIINAVQQAPLWTIASYQQAIRIDSYNPTLRLELGSVYYLLEQYEQAQRLFEQSVSLKPDWANAHYNLAWAYYQNEMYGQAVQQMQIVTELLDPATAEEDYKKAQKDLELMQDKAKEQAATGQTEETAEEVEGEELNLPSPPTATVEPRLELPEEASPQTDETVQP